MPDNATNTDSSKKKPAPIMFFILFRSGLYVSMLLLLLCIYALIFVYQHDCELADSFHIGIVGPYTYTSNYIPGSIVSMVPSNAVCRKVRYTRHDFAGFHYLYDHEVIEQGGHTEEVIASYFYVSLYYWILLFSILPAIHSYKYFKSRSSGS
jgi:hypothetical protein